MENPIKFDRTIAPSGSSKVIAIPPEIIEALKLKLRDEVKVWIEDGIIHIKKEK